MSARTARRSWATWLMAWALAVAIASTISLLTAVDSHQAPTAVFVNCPVAAECSR